MSRFLSTFSLILFWCLPGCSPQTAAPAKKTAPAKIEHSSEGDIHRVVLTAKAEERLQISTVAVEKKSVPRTRTVGGIITVPDGAALTVTAPLTGTLLLPDSEQQIVAGQTVTPGQAVFLLRPLLSPDREVPTAAERVAMANARASLVSSRIIAEGDVEQSQAQVAAAQIAFDRARRLVADKAGSQRDVDDAQARLEIAKSTLSAAAARQRLLEKLTLEADAGQVTTIPVEAPRSGILRTVASSVGQTVSAGAPLFEVVNLNTLWLRVPVFPGLLEELAPESNTLVRRFGDSTPNFKAKPVAAPPMADPLAATIDLFFELQNPNGEFRPGERVEVILPLTGTAESLVIPRAAILRDIHGIAWVYANSAEQTFERHRVEVQFTTDALAVLSRGPKTGTLVVVDGAAELFGTEFGAGK